MSQLAAQKLARLQATVAERAACSEQVAQINRMHGWLLEVEHVLDESLAQPAQGVSNATVGSRLDAWRAQMALRLTDGTLCELEQECLTKFLQGLDPPAPLCGAVLRSGGLSPHQQ